MISRAPKVEATGTSKDRQRSHSAARRVSDRVVANPALRPEVRGPFLWLGDRKLTVKAATYGTFAADHFGDLFPPRNVVRSDFAAMRSTGFNVIRTYTKPPDWLLDEARSAGLRVLVGMFWEARNCNFDEPEALESALDVVRRTVSRCRRYPDVVLAYVIGNEIPPLVTRFHGRRIIEGFLRRLYEVAKELDPKGLVTYGNYPSTEFLQLDFLDFHTLNLYLLEPRTLSAYLDRAMIQAQGKPLLLGEIGDDSLRPGQQHQADLLDWTIPLVLNKGVAGLCIFSWTDEWVVGGHPVDDWQFGLVDKDRKPKAALEVAAHRLQQSPLDFRTEPWPRVSVVVCNYNGDSTLRETLASLLQIDYPDYEVIYIDDGSTDDSLSTARTFEPRIKIVAQENRGLSAARNVGAETATGEIVAYIDSDAFADPEWLRYLVLAMESGDYVAVGGPNLTPASDGLTAQFIAMCPGNPTYVLKDNARAEHIAGVNMAYRRDALLSLGGFDPVHRKAGDDVDICWRLEDSGMKIAFSPVAIVWHHRRPSLWTYVKQQYGYGEAENQLEVKHPERFNLGGYIRWGGRVYLGPKSVSGFFRPLIYHGRLGNGLFQTLYQKDPSYFMYGPSMIHWYFAWALLFALSPLSLWLLPVAGTLFAMSVWVAFVQGVTSEVNIRLTRTETARKIWVISLLHFLHPIVRWWGRVAPRRSKGPTRSASTGRRKLGAEALFDELGYLGRGPKELRRYWGPGSGDREKIVRALHRELKGRRISAALSQDWDNHDLLLNGSVVAVARIYTSPEHYDQAVCCGFKVRTARPTIVALLLTSLLATALLTQDPRWLPVLAVPLWILYRSLVARARLRRAAWESVAAVMERRGAKRFEATG